MLRTLFSANSSGIVATPNALHSVTKRNKREGDQGQWAMFVVFYFP
jgi:hypothetical protein